MSPSEIPSLDALLDYFEKVRERTRRVALCIPPERIEWSWREGKFTHGNLLRHLAEGVTLAL